jgi:hypothetical protein
MNALLQVGVSAASIKEARLAINDILKSRMADESTKVVALGALKSLCEVNNTSITNCNFEG